MKQNFSGYHNVVKNGKAALSLLLNLHLLPMPTLKCLITEFH